MPHNDSFLSPWPYREPWISSHGFKPEFTSPFPSTSCRPPLPGSLLNQFHRFLKVRSNLNIGYGLHSCWSKERMLSLYMKPYVEYVHGCIYTHTFSHFSRMPSAAYLKLISQGDNLNWKIHHETMTWAVSIARSIKMNEMALPLA